MCSGRASTTILVLKRLQLRGLCPLTPTKGLCPLDPRGSFATLQFTLRGAAPWAYYSYPLPCPQYNPQVDRGPK